MKTIVVNQIIKSAFSQEKALLLRKTIEECLKDEDKVILDFSGISKFTTLFFNFCTGYIISAIGPDNYDEKISLINLSPLGQSTYESSYRNAVEKYIPNKQVEEKILNIIKNPEV